MSDILQAQPAKRALYKKFPTSALAFFIISILVDLSLLIYSNFINVLTVELELDINSSQLLSYSTFIAEEDFILNSNIKQEQPTLYLMNSLNISFINLMTDCQMNEKCMISYKSSNDSISNSATISITMFHITVPNSMSTYWKCKAYPVAIISFFATFIWPYFRSLLILFLFLFPLKYETQKRFIFCLHQSTKIGYLFMYNMILSTLIFSFNITHISNVKVHMKVNPMKGMVIYIIAILFSQMITHVLCYVFYKYGKELNIGLLENVDYIDIQFQKQMDNERKCCKNEWFSIKTRFAYKLSPAQSWISIIFYAIFLTTLLSSCWYLAETLNTSPTIYNLSGIIGAVTDVTHFSYSTVNFATVVISSVMDSFAGNAYFVAIVFYFITFGIPIFVQFLLILIWFIVPFQFARYEWMSNVLWIAQSWNAVDIFCVDLIGSLQMNLISEYLIDTEMPELCGSDGIVHRLLDGKCYVGNGKFTRGWYMLVSIAVFQWAVLWYTGYIVKQYRKKVEKTSCL